MQNNEIEELYEFYSSLSEKEVCEKIVELLYLYKISNMENKSIIQNLIDNEYPEYLEFVELNKFDPSNIQNYVTDKICDIEDEEEDCHDKFYNYQEKVFSEKLNEIPRSELMEIFLDTIYNVLIDLEKNDLVKNIMKIINDQKVNNQQLKLLGGVNKVKLTLPKKFKVLKEDSSILVARHGDSIIKFESEEDDDYNYVFNASLNEMFVSAIATNHYEGFVEIKIGNVKEECPPNIKNKFCSIIEEDLVKGQTLNDWIRKEIKSEKLGSRLPKILLKVFENLYRIHKDTGYTHYDLHIGNIMISDDDTPHIIDYGYSYVNYNGENYGTFLPFGEIYNRPMWLHDIFKLLMFCFESIKNIILVNNYDVLLRNFASCVFKYKSQLKVLNKSNRIKLGILHNYGKKFWDELELLPLEKNYMKDNAFRIFYDKFIQFFDMIHTFLVLNKALNMILNQYNLSLILKEFENKPEDWITDDDYKNNYNGFYAPTKFMQDTNKITFEKFIKKFSNNSSYVMKYEF